MIKLTEINTDLFTRVSLTTFGVRFEIFDKEKREENELHKSLDSSYFHYIFNVTREGYVNINSRGFSRLTVDQLAEISRVAGILNENKNDKEKNDE